jgi:PKD domain-containing protein
VPAHAASPVFFTSTSTTPSGAAINSYTWTFGDGFSCPASCGGAVGPLFPTPDHTYPSVGVSGTVTTYNVSLTVKDTNNLTSTVTVSVPVTTP